MTTFVLVHGSWHGGWCWERVVPELNRLGHEAVVVDLPYSDVRATIADMAAAVTTQITDPERTVLVAHSSSGLVAPVVAARLPLREMVFLAALLPLPGHSWNEQLASEKPFRDEFVATYVPRQRKDVQGRSYWEPQDAAGFLYHDCSPEDAATATARMRPQAANLTAERTPLTAIPQIASRYIVCRQDRGVSESWAVATAPERYGSTVCFIDSSHAPYWSRPAELAALLSD